jgi:transmembrane sensor
MEQFPHYSLQAPLSDWINSMGMDKKDLDNYRLGDFITDETFVNYCLRNNPDDIIFWKKWIADHPEKILLVEESENTIRNFSFTLPEEEYQEELSKITRALRPESSAAGFRSVFRIFHWSKPDARRKGERKYTRRWMIPAALLLIAALYFYISIPSGSIPVLMENINNGNIPLVFTLSDGSVITLAPHSGLKYPRKFDPVTRKVYLNGEASFHVAADSKHPFKVFQDDMICTVLGTIFTIRKDRKDSVMMVELMKGKLKVEIMATATGPVQSIFLSPNERVVYTQYNRKLFKEKWQIEIGAPIKIDRLLFKQDNFEAIAKKIQNSFGITLINKSDKKPWRFTGEFTNATAGEIISSICEIEGLTSEVEGDTILIK